MADSAQILAEDLMRIHKVVTRGLEVAESQFSANLGPDCGADANPAGFMMFLTCLFSFMLSHHEGEDEIGFPYLKKKADEIDFQKLIDDHKAMHPLIVEAQGLLGNATDVQTPGKLREIVSDLRQLWLNHVGDEEKCFGCELISRRGSVQCRSFCCQSSKIAQAGAKRLGTFCGLFV